MSTLVKDHFQPGEIVLTCRPWISSVEIEIRDFVCANCFTHVSKLHKSASMKKCSSCKAVSYCGVRCQAPHWKEEHKLECDFMKRLIESKEGRLMFPSQDFDGVNQFGAGAGPAEAHLTSKMMVLKLVNKILRGSAEDPEFPTEFGMFLAINCAVPYVHSRLLTEQPGIHVVDMNLGGPGLGEVDNCEEREHKPTIMAAFGLTEEEYRDKLGSKYNIEEFLYRFCSTATWVTLPGNRYISLGATLYLDTTQTEVSCEPNCIMHEMAKTLTIRATEQMPKPLRLANCKLAFHPRVMGFYSFPDEIKNALASTGKSCSGKYCTPEYHAEMLPLRCVNTSCDQPLPSDDRAFQPCPKCESIMPKDLLKTGLLRLDEFRNCYSDTSRPAVDRVAQLRSDPFVHPDNLFAVLVISGSLEQLARQPGYLWSTAREMLPFIRKCYPKNDLYLARLLESVAGDYKNSVQKSDRQLEEGMEILREAYEIQVQIGVRAELDIGQACNLYGIINRN